MYDEAGPTYEVPDGGAGDAEWTGWTKVDPLGRGWYWEHSDGRTLGADEWEEQYGDGDGHDGDGGHGDGDGHDGDGGHGDGDGHDGDGGHGRGYGDGRDGNGGHGDGRDGDGGHGYKGHRKGKSKGKGKGYHGRKGKGKGKGKGKTKGQAASRDGSGYYVDGGFVTAVDGVFHRCLGYFKHTCWE